MNQNFCKKTYLVGIDARSSAIRRDGISPKKVYRQFDKSIENIGEMKAKQGSVRIFESDHDEITLNILIESSLKSIAPLFCKYAESVWLIPISGRYNITHRIANRPIVRDLFHPLEAA